MLKKMQLKNGMDVFLFKSTKAPVVSTRVWVKTGSADEKKGEEGLSHFIEHLVFKGSKNLNVGDAAKKIEGSGGQLNAYTSFDETVFHVTQHKDEFEVGLEVLSEMLGYPTFDATEVDNEREVVLEEIKRTQDNPSREASRLMFSTVYKKHPYGIPVIGYAKNISDVSNEQIRDYFNRRYVPENMFLVISGDFEMTEAKKSVRKYFEPIPKRRLKKVVREKEPEQKRTRIKVKQTDFKQNMINLSFPIPKITHKDIAALDMLAMVLGQSESSLFNKILRLEKEVVRYAYSSMFASKDKGFFNISLSVDKEKINEALEELIPVFEVFFSGEWDKEIIEVSKASLRSDEIYPYETVDGISRKIGYYEYNFKDPEFSKKYLDTVSELSVKEVYKAFKKYLVPEKLSLSILSENKEEILNDAAKDWIKKYRKFYKDLKIKSGTQELSAKKAKKIKALKNAKTVETTEEVLPSGVRLYVRQTQEIPVVSVRLAALGGVRIEPRDKGGLSELTTLAWGKTTPSFDEDELAKFVELKSSSISTFCGKNTNGLSMTTISPYFGEMFDLYLEALLNPVFNDRIIAREKHLMKQGLLQQQDNPAQMCIKQFMAKMYPGHPYGRNSMGSQESLDSITKADIESFYKNIFASKRLSLCLSGDVKQLDTVKEKIDIAFKNWKGQEDRLKKNKPENITSDLTAFTELQKEQSHILLGYDGITIESKDKFALDIMQAVLAGQGGRLFLELRDKNSLAYSLSPMRMDALDAGFFGAYIACSPEKGKKAIEMILQEFDKLTQNQIGANEMNRAKKYIIGKYHIELQKNSAFTSSILFNDIYGVSSKEVFEYKNNIMNVQAKDVQKLAERIFSQPKVMSAIGKVCPW